jgi:uncharacterized protein (TIGR02594 family)
MSTFDTAPAWFKWALHEVGTRELPENRGPAIRRYISLAHAGHEGDPWCAVFANAALESVNVHGTKSAGSQSFRENEALFVELPGPVLGAIAVFWRGSRHSGLGHVGFYRGESYDGNHIYVLGGNEKDCVMIEALPKNGVAMGLVGYWWPAGVPMPLVAKVIMPHDAPTLQTKVT